MIVQRLGLFLILIATMTCGSAYGCPNLSGQYSCVTDDLIEAVTVRQTTDFHSVTVDINDSPLVVDDTDRPLSDEDPTFRNVIVHVSCNDSSVTRHLIGDFYDGQKKVGAIDTTIEYSIVNGALVESTTGKMTNVQGDISLDEKLVCERQKEI